MNDYLIKCIACTQLKKTFSQNNIFIITLHLNLNLKKKLILHNTLNDLILFFYSWFIQIPNIINIIYNK